MFNNNRITLIGNTGEEAKTTPNGPATLPKGTSLFVEGQLVYEQYPRKVETTVGKKMVEVEVMTRVAKVRVQRLIRLEPSGEPGGDQADTTEVAQG